MYLELEWVMSFVIAKFTSDRHTQLIRCLVQSHSTYRISQHHASKIYLCGIILSTNSIRSVTKIQDTSVSLLCFELSSSILATRAMMSKFVKNTFLNITKKYKNARTRQFNLQSQLMRINFIRVQVRFHSCFKKILLYIRRK